MIFSYSFYKNERGIIFRHFDTSKASCLPSRNGRDRAVVRLTQFKVTVSNTKQDELMIAYLFSLSNRSFSVPVLIYNASDGNAAYRMIYDFKKTDPSLSYVRWFV